MTTIGFDARVLTTGRRSGVEEYAHQLLEHMLPLDRSIQWKIFRGKISNRGLWLATRLIGRPYLDRLVGGADIFFFPHFLLGATSPTCKRVMTWHDLSYERMPELFSWRRRVWHQVQMQPRKQARRADRIIAVSQSTANDLTALYHINPAKVSVVHSGVDPQLSRVEASPAYRSILALGTREPRKNLDTLVAAFDRLAAQKDLNDVRLIIAGPSGWLERPLRRAIAQSLYRDRIILRDAVDGSERAQLLSSASVLAYPSLMEGFGFPPLEAMACGTPVVAGATSALFETVGNAGLLINPYSIDQLANALSEVLRDVAVRSRLIEAGYAHVQSFSWKTTAEKTLEAMLQ